jgi:AcrR family transcriptional regulator
MKEKIINQAIELFNEFGPRFSMETLSKKLKISKKTLYKYFSSKEKLLEYIIDESFNEIHQKQEIIYSSNLGCESKLREILTTSFSREDSIRFEKIQEIKKYYPILFNKIEERYKQQWDYVEELLLEGEKNNIFEFWSISYLIALMKSAMSLVISHLDGSISYKNAINQSINSLVDSIKKED